MSKIHKFFKTSVKILHKLPILTMKRYIGQSPYEQMRLSMYNVGPKLF